MSGGQVHSIASDDGVEIRIVTDDKGKVTSARAVNLTEPLLIYVAGPYRAGHGRSVRDNINAASKAAAEIWSSGHYALCPHMNTAFMEKYAHCPDERFLEGDLRMLSHCDGAVFLPRWYESQGAMNEMKFAQQKGLITWIYPSVPPPPESVCGSSV